MGCSFNALIAAHFYMANSRNRYIEAMRELYARISSQRVLCIDSNPYLRNFVCWFVSDVGCEVSAAANAGEAIAMVQGNPNQYDVLILADWLPDMDGLELVRQLRAMSYFGRIAVTTAKELLPEPRNIYESLGVSSIIVTPIGYAELMRILEQAARSLEGSGRGEETFRKFLPTSA